MLLERLGRREEGRAVLEEALVQAKRNGPSIESEVRWGKLARERLSALERQ
jgi:hypothetical protein